MSRPDGGFTILELLVVMVVFGIIIAEIGQGLDFGLRASTLQAQLLSQRADLDGVDRLLRGIVARIDPGSVAEPPRLAGTDGSFMFTTDLPPGAAPPLQRHVDASLAVDGASRLVLSWAPHIHHLRPAGPTSPQDTLLTGIARIQFSYLYPDGAPHKGWSERWSEPYLPRLVRIHVSFPAGDPRQWPDIVVEPAQDRPSG